MTGNRKSNSRRLGQRVEYDGYLRCDAKVCSLCLIKQPATRAYFTRYARSASGLSSQCKRCRAEHAKGRYSIRRPEAIAHRRAWLLRNRAHNNAMARARAARDPERRAKVKLSRLALEERRGGTYFDRYKHTRQGVCARIVVTLKERGCQATMREVCEHFIGQRTFETRYRAWCDSKYNRKLKPTVYSADRSNDFRDWTITTWSNVCAERMRRRWASGVFTGCSWGRRPQNGKRGAAVPDEAPAASLAVGRLPVEAEG